MFTAHPRYGLGSDHGENLRIAIRAGKWEPVGFPARAMPARRALSHQINFTNPTSCPFGHRAVIFLSASLFATRTFAPHSGHVTSITSSFSGALMMPTACDRARAT